MTLIKGCEQHLEGVGSFFQPPHSVKGLKDKTFEKLYHWFVKILEINETCIHPIIRTKNFDTSKKLGLNMCMKSLKTENDSSLECRK